MAKASAGEELGGRFALLGLDLSGPVIEDEHTAAESAPDAMSNGELFRAAMAAALDAVQAGQIVGLVDRVECDRIEHQADAHDAYLARHALGRVAALLVAAPFTGLAQHTKAMTQHVAVLLAADEGPEVAA